MRLSHLLLLFLTLFAAAPASGISTSLDIVPVQVLYTGNNEVELIYTIGPYGKGLLYRDDVLLATQLAPGIKTMVDTGLAKGGTYTYKWVRYSSAQCVGPECSTHTETTTVTTGLVAGMITRDITWDGGAWKVDHLVLCGGSLIIKNGATVTTGGIVGGVIWYSADPTNPCPEGTRHGGGISIEGASVNELTFRRDRFQVTPDPLLQASITVNNSDLDNITIDNLPLGGFSNNREPSVSQGSRITGSSGPVSIRNNQMPKSSIILKPEVGQAQAANGAYAFSGNSLSHLELGSSLERLESGSVSVTGNTIKPFTIYDVGIGLINYGPGVNASVSGNKSDVIFLELMGDKTNAPPPINKTVSLNTANSIVISGSVGVRVANNRVSSLKAYQGTGIRIVTLYKIKRAFAGFNEITGNYISGLRTGIALQGNEGGAENNVVSRNYIDNNTTGISIAYARNNRIFDNIILQPVDAAGAGAAVTACETGMTCQNSWNESRSQGANIVGGAYIGGNYWSSYTGIDTDRDGLGNTPFTINTDNADYLPLTLDIIVNTTGDAEDYNTGDGLCDVDPVTPGEQCTLRAALMESNARPFRNIIGFSIPGAGLPVITPMSSLPNITDTVTINALMQPGGAVEINGAGTVSDGLRVSAEASIKGLNIRQFSGNGIVADADLNLENVRVGGNSGAGILMNHGALSNSGFLDVSANGDDGIRTFGLNRQGAGSVAAELQSVKITTNAGRGIYSYYGSISIAGSDNEISGNRGGSGVLVINSGDVTASGGLTVADNAGYGIDSNYSVTIQDWVKVTGNKEGGILSNDGGIIASGVSFLDVTGNGQNNPYSGYGIHARGRGNVFLANVAIQGNKRGGVYATNHNITISGVNNLVKNNGGSGILTLHGGVDLFGGIEISGNKGRGISSSGSVDIHDWGKINANEMGGILSDEAGVWAVDVTLLEVIGNGAKNQFAGHGIQAKGYGDLSVINAVVTNNRGKGLRAGGNLKVKNGRVCDNRAGDISAGGTLDVTDNVTVCTTPVTAATGITMPADTSCIPVVDKSLKLHIPALQVRVGSDTLGFSADLQFQTDQEGNPVFSLTGSGPAATGATCEPVTVAEDLSMSIPGLLLRFGGNDLPYWADLAFIPGQSDVRFRLIDSGSH